MNMKSFIIGLCFAFSSIVSYAQSIRINEVMSSNGRIIVDSDNDASDWIELFNDGTRPINLNGFGLSDDKSDPFKWTFPDYAILPDEYLLVFASDKNRRESPIYWNTIISRGDEWQYLVPSAEPAESWRLSSFVDTDWQTGKSGFGMGDDDDATQVTVSSSIFLRKKFTVTHPDQVEQLLLHMDYDDGFVAYLNGVEIARAHMDGTGSFPRFDALASLEHEALIYNRNSPEKFSVSNPAALLQAGENILAIQVHNVNPASTDITAIPFLTVGTTLKPEVTRVADILMLSNIEFHTNFKLDADGESLYLTNYSGILVDSVRIKGSHLNCSYGRSSKIVSHWMIFNPSTPGAVNSGTEFSGEMAARPVFSQQGGIYPSALKVAITAANSTDSIYYTLDGSIPTRASQRVVGEIDLPTSRVIRARIIKAGMLPGEVVTNSYIISPNHQMPVVSLAMNPADLWDFNTGIYVDGPFWTAQRPHFGANYWMDWERACHMEIMEASGDRVIDMDAGVKIFGNHSRAHAQKSLAIYSRKAYGYDEINYKLFTERPFDTYKNIVLRNSGNDWNNTMFRDGLASGLTYGLNFLQQAFRPAIIYLNGEYWGIQNIREKINEHMIAQHYKVDPENITMIERNGRPVLGSADDYWTMIRFLENNTLSVESNYNRMLEWIDVNSFIDYYASEIYFRNDDWPGNNIRCWKTNDEKGRWRWILYDTDFGMGIWNLSPADNSLASATDPNGPYRPNPPWSTLMLRRMIENPGFREQFVNRFADLLNSNFRADVVNKAIDLKRDAIVDEIDRHLLRWNGSKDYWLSNVRDMKNFATTRPGYVFSHIQGKFNFQNPQIITLEADSMQGLVQLNSLKLSKFPWKGSYFPDVPVTLTALPKVGYKFAGWTGAGPGNNSPVIQVIPQANLVITALFVPDEKHYDDVVINEISYNNNGNSDPGDWVELSNIGETDIDISGWKMTDSDPSHQYIFQPRTILRAKGHLVLSNDLTQIKSVFPGLTNLYGPFSFGLSNSQDAVKIYSDEGQLIDEVNYRNAAPWKTGDMNELWSIELKNPSLDNGSGANWSLSVNHGTPGMRNAAYLPDAVEEFPVAESPDPVIRNFPNPFSDGTYLEFELNKPGKYQISIYDMYGRSLKTFSGGDQLSIAHTIYWDGKDEAGQLIAPGVYLYRLEANGRNTITRMVKVK